MAVSEDCYVSFRGSQRRDFGEVTHASPVIFVDLDLHDEDGAVLRLPPAFMAQRDATLIFRLENVTDAVDLPRSVAASIATWSSVGRIARLIQPLGEAPKLEVLHGSDLSEEEQKEVLARARAVELEALLDFGQAIWRPSNFHYRLITGEHAGAYIKLGDAIRRPRDAEVLASWLHCHIRENTGVILDTGTLTPVAQALQTAAARSGVNLGQITTLDNYPRTVVDVGATLDRVSGDDGRILVVLSVSSTGSLLERVQNALARKGDSIEPEIVLMVNKGEESSLEEVDLWSPLQEQKPLVPSGSPGEIGCRWCREPGRATVVPINPFTFDAMLPAQFETEVPDIEDPKANRPLWEAAQRTGAIAVEQPAHQAVRRYRSDKVPMGIVMRSERLITDQGFRDALKSRVTELQETSGMRQDSDLVLVPEHEAGEEHFDEFWGDIRTVIAPSVEVVTPYPLGESFSPELEAAIQGAATILVFQLGTVSGGTIQRALVGVQGARGHDDHFALHGFIVHARPATRRELDTITNSYGKVGPEQQLRIGWTSVLPDRSPLREEHISLRTLDTAELTPPQKAFFETRSQLCGGGYVDDRAPVLWGSKPEDHLTPNAIYGHDLDPATTYVAVGSAMAAALGTPDLITPEVRVFEMAAIARSYYDPLILGSMLRWLRPHEIFWGWTGAEAKTTALHIVARAEGLGRQILVPEMLLAAAQGKLTREVASVAVAAASTLVDDPETPEEVRASAEVGLLLVSDHSSLPTTDGLYQSG